MDERASLAPLGLASDRSPEPSARPASGRWVQAALAALTINLRCLAILTALSVALLIVAAVLDVSQLTAET
jgi:hypothetical protein